jgi:wobble nucleotide-excising tRNase
VEFELDNGAKIAGDAVENANLPPIRVFNRDFVDRTIESIGASNVAPIYFLGAQSIEQQKHVDGLKQDLVKTQADVAKANDEKIMADKALDVFCVEKAKLIKEALLGSADYANYDKRRFRLAATSLKGKSIKPAALSDEEKDRLRRQKQLQAKPSIAKVFVAVPDIERLRSQVTALLERSIVSQVIDELANDSAVSAWVQQGLNLHQGERKTDTCRFCGNQLSAERRAALEAHFNDAFAAFQQDLVQVINGIERQCRSLKAVAFPDESRVYDHLVEEIRPVVTNSKLAIQSVNQELDDLIKALERKKAQPFEALRLDEGEHPESTEPSPLDAAINAVNVVIDKHETTTTNLNDEVRRACQLLEQDYTLEALPKFEALNKSVAEAEATLSTTKEKPNKLRNQISTIERKIVEHRRPAEELNNELRAYLGRDELQFDIKDTGYALTRGGQPALNLSEGERTAIAFLYFLKSLEDRDFDLSKGIVVIDDPVSSLDANSLFSAFGYMKERTKACHQLIILTHNFSFFRQVKNWFHHLKGQNRRNVEKRPGRFYTILTTHTEGERTATLSPIDPLLEQFESEYHFLFRQIYDLANSAAASTQLADLYGVPNMARRLLETFMSYRFPDAAGDLFKRFERCDFNAEKKTTILRLLNTYSHSGGISEPEHDPSVLGETQAVLLTILELIEFVDNDHYQGMIKLLNPAEEEE